VSSQDQLGCCLGGCCLFCYTDQVGVQGSKRVNPTGCVPGSGHLGAVAQMTWLGQPWHAAAWPAASLEVPGQSAP
jgi:hypothetical protein